MNPFTQVINGWHDFYVVIGTASATLIGLLFVSLSINADAISKKSNTDLRLLAEQTFSTFLFVVLFAVNFLIPNQSPNGLGLPLVGIGGAGLITTLGHFIRTRHYQPREWGRGGIASRFIVPTVCYIVLLMIAGTVLFGKTDGLYCLVPVMILMILNSSLNAWHLLLRLREPEIKE